MSLDPRIEQLVDVLVDVLMREYVNEKRPGPFGDSPGSSGVLLKQRSSDSDCTAVLMRSSPEGKTGDQNHSKQIAATSAPDDRVGGEAIASGRTGEDMSQ